ncbi:hypothetical protein AQUCO_03400091v1 [Aquilegia coerulea]|uniref:Glycosyltransferase n=1 Tax=Aquilegia coerulea TaxID=218851 RepID=A0A2G5CXF6_AQUCA|nr:hypothetical protein AQUCO_03400091v1 [Aquilegia coerulea]
MVKQENQNHYLLVTFPAQGHINPALQFAKRLTSTGGHITFVTSVHGQKRILNKSTLISDGITFSPFSDGYDDGFKSTDGGNNDEAVDRYMSEIRRCGKEALVDLVVAHANGHRPITCLVYTLLLPWAAEVAREYQLQSALLWIQPATVFDVYYYYFSGYSELINDNINDPSYSIQLPGLPLLKSQDLPSFFLPSNTYSFGLKLFQEQFALLLEETESFQILVNTFDELEPESLKAIDKFKISGIGPLVPSAFLVDKGMSDKSSEGDTRDYMEWLSSKDKSSVVYVSFGSIAVLTNKQMAELARGLVDSGRPFLWVIRSGENEPKQQDKDENERYKEILLEEHKGMIVPWCSQVEVLNHTSIGCFVTHCGWNSTLESISMGVPVVAFPQWTDQGTNAKLIEDVWKMGVRVRPSDEEDKIVKSEEVIRCLKEVMEGEKGEELRKNAKKWKELAREAVKEGGSSERNLRAFVEQIGLQ